MITGGEGASAEHPPQDVARPSVKRNVGVLLGTQILTWAASLVLVVALPRYLGSAAIGQYRLANSVWLIAASFIGLGTQMLVTLEVARRQRDGVDIVAPAVFVRLAGFLVVSCVVAVLVVAADYGSDIAVLLAVMGLATLARTVGDVAIAALQGLEDFASPSIATIVERFASTVAILAALVLGAGVDVVVTIGLATAILQTAMLYRFLQRRAPVRRRADVGEVVAVARRGLPFLFGAVAMVAYHETDTIMMSLLVADEAIGWYAAADRLMATSLFVPTIVMSALFPTFARLHQEDAATAGAMVERGFRSLIVISVPIGFGLATLSTPLALLLFGEEFRQSGPVLAVLAVVLMIMFQTILVGNYAVASGHERFYFALIFLGVLATIPLDLVLVPWADRALDNGAVGGALAYIVTETAILVVGVRRFAPQVADRATLVRTVKCLIAGSAMVAAVWPLRHVVLPVPIVVGAVVYAAVTVAFSTLSADERAAITALVVKARARLRPAN